MKDKKIIYTFSSWLDYDDLMRYLEDKGILWYDEEKPTEWQEIKELNLKPSEIIIRLENGFLRCGDIGQIKSYNDYKQIHWIIRKTVQKVDKTKAICYNNTKEEKMKVYVLMDTSEDTGAGSIIGIYKDKTKARLALADYVLANKPFRFDYIELAEHEVIE